MQKYIISILITFTSLTAFSQEQELPQRQFFIRGGVDLSRFTLPFIYDDATVSGFEVSLDSEIKYNFFPTIEFGMNNIEYKTNDINYDAIGSYFRVGLNYNMLKYQHRLDRNIFFIGARYAFSGFEQQSGVLLENEWGEYETSFPKENLTQHWAEATMGLRGEILKNFYMGYTLRVKIRLSKNDNQGLTPYFVPGYGRSDDAVAIGMSYSMFYAIPIIRIK